MQNINGALMLDDNPSWSGLTVAQLKSLQQVVGSVTIVQHGSNNITSMVFGDQLKSVAGALVVTIDQSVHNVSVK